MPVVPDWWKRSNQILPLEACPVVTATSGAFVTDAVTGAGAAVATDAATGAGVGVWAERAGENGDKVANARAHASDRVIRIRRIGKPAPSFGKRTALSASTALLRVVSE